jgi:hypothetical protein
MSKPVLGFHKYSGAGKKQYEKEQEEKRKKQSPTKPFEDAAKATEGLRQNIRKMGENQQEEERKKKEGTGVQPTKGFFGRMLDKYRSK